MWPCRNSTLAMPASAALARARSSISRCHVESVREAARSDASSRQQDVDPASGAEIEHDVTGVEVGDGDRVAAPEARQRGRLGQAAELVVVGEAPVRRVASVVRSLPRLGRASGRRVHLANLVMDRRRDLHSS